MPRETYYENTVHNLGLYLAGQDFDQARITKVTAQLRQFHSGDLITKFGNSTDLALAARAKRYTTGQGAGLLVQVQKANWLAGRINEFCAIFDEKLVRPLEDDIFIGIEFRKGELLPFRTWSSELVGSYYNFIGTLPAPTPPQV